MGAGVQGLLTGFRNDWALSATEGGRDVTQSDTSMALSTQRDGTVPFRRGWAVEEPARTESARSERGSWQERMGLTVEDALDLPEIGRAHV